MLQSKTCLSVYEFSLKEAVGNDAANAGKELVYSPPRPNNKNKSKNRRWRLWSHHCRKIQLKRVGSCDMYDARSFSRLILWMRSLRSLNPSARLIRCFYVLFRRIRIIICTTTLRATIPESPALSRTPTALAFRVRISARNSATAPPIVRTDFPDADALLRLARGI